MASNNINTPIHNALKTAIENDPSFQGVFETYLQPGALGKRSGLYLSIDKTNTLALKKLNPVVSFFRLFRLYKPENIRLSTLQEKINGELKAIQTYNADDSHEDKIVVDKSFEKLAARINFSTYVHDQIASQTPKYRENLQTCLESGMLGKKSGYYLSIDEKTHEFSIKHLTGFGQKYRERLHPDTDLSHIKNELSNELINIHTQEKTPTPEFLNLFWKYIDIDFLKNKLSNELINIHSQGKTPTPEFLNLFWKYIDIDFLKNEISNDKNTPQKKLIFTNYIMPLITEQTKFGIDYIQGLIKDCTGSDQKWEASAFYKISSNDISPGSGDDFNLLFPQQLAVDIERQLTNTTIIVPQNINSFLPKETDEVKADEDRTTAMIAYMNALKSIKFPTLKENGTKTQKLAYNFLSQKTHTNMVVELCLKLQEFSQELGVPKAIKQLWTVSRSEQGDLSYKHTLSLNPIIGSTYSKLSTEIQFEILLKADETCHFKKISHKILDVEQKTN